MRASPIRFGVQAGPGSDPAAWRELARRLEGDGFEALYVADHLGATASPFAALAAAAGVTSTLGVCTYVCNVGIRDPVSLAADAATVDLLSNGRLVLGLGAGHTPAEWRMTGAAYPSAAARVGRLVETVEVVERLLRREVVTFDGRHVRTHEATVLTPSSGRPIELLIGGNGPTVLELGARRATRVSLSGLVRTLEDGHRHEVDWTDAAMDRRVALVRAHAPGPYRPLLDALVQHVELTDRRDDVAERMARRVIGAGPGEILSSPFALVGTIDELADEVTRAYERWGIASYVVRESAVDAIAQLITRLAR